MSAAAFLLCCAGIFCIAVAMQKHSRHIFSRALAPRTVIALRAGGWLLLALSLGVSVATWAVALGTITWLGIFLLASFANTAVLTLMRVLHPKSS